MQSKHQEQLSSFDEKVVQINNLERQVLELQYKIEVVQKESQKKDDEIEEIVSY
jgi:hypothetical protein